MALKWLQTPSCRSSRTASRNAAARSTRIARSTFLPRSCIVPMGVIIGGQTKRAPEGALGARCRADLLLSLFVALAGLVAERAANNRAADRADRAASGRRRADGAACDRAADRTLGFIRNTAVFQRRAARHARGEDDSECNKKLAHVMTSGLQLVRRVLQSRSVAAAQQENHEQDRDGHAKGPQQDVTQLAFLLPAPLLQLFHITSKLSVSGYAGGSKHRAALALPCQEFHYQIDQTERAPEGALSIHTRRMRVSCRFRRLPRSP